MGKGRLRLVCIALIFLLAFTGCSKGEKPAVKEQNDNKSKTGQKGVPTLEGCLKDIRAAAQVNIEVSGKQKMWLF